MEDANMSARRREARLRYRRREERVAIDKRAGRRRLLRRDDDKKVEAKEDDEESDDEDKSTSSKSASSTTASSASSASSTSLAPPPSVTVSSTAISTALPPPSSTIVSSTAALVSTPPPPSSTLLPSTSTTFSSQISPPPAATSIADSAVTDQAQAQSVDNSKGGNGGRNQGSGSPTAATVALAILGSLAAVGLIAFFVWKCYRRRRGREQSAPSMVQDPFGPPTDIRAADQPRYSQSVYSVDKADRARPRSGWSGSTPGWFRTLTQRKSPPPPAPERPKEAAVSRWMGRHTSRMLDPMSARASIVSSTASGLGPPPSVSPASVVGGNRESVLSEMGQIRRDAVPPPLDMAMVERVRQMQDQTTSVQREEAMAGLQPPPTVGRPAAGSPSVITNSTWNTWGVEQHQKR